MVERQEHRRAPVYLQKNGNMEKLDQGAFNLAKAIRNTETGGSKDPYNQKGASGEFGAYQFMPATYKALAKQHLGDENAAPTIENQNKIAYTEIKRLKDAGKTPAEIASYWNSGKTTAYKDGLKGTNKQGVNYDVPAYVTKVSDYYKQFSTTAPTIAPIPQISASEQADIASKEKYGATFGSKTDGSILGAGARTLGNIPKSAFNFVKGALDAINPVTIVKNIKEIASGTKELAEEKGGYGKAFGAIAKELPKTAYEVVPEFARMIIKGDIEEAQRAITNDPVGSIAPFLLLAKPGAKGIDKLRTKAAVSEYVKSPYTKKTIPKPITAAGDFVEGAISKTAGAVTGPIKSVFGGIGRARDYATSQATGLSPETIRTIKESPKAFSKKSMSEIDRATVGRQVQSQLSKLAEEKSTTGKEYQPVRASGKVINVDTKFWDNTFKETTGLEIKKGRLNATTTSKIRDAGDVRALQKVYEFWKPKFKQGKLTAEEYLNMREDLAKASRFEKDLGKRKDVEVLTGQIRAKVNQTYRPQIKGLKELDAKMSSQMAEYKELAKGIIDKNGTVTDAGLSRIANLSKNKPNLAIQLEKILPGITEQVKILQAVVDIERAGGIKVGTTRAAVTGGAFIGGGVIPGIITAVLTSPEVAVPLLRQYGLIKNATAVKAVTNALRDGAGFINKLPEKTTGKTTIFGANAQK